MGMDHVEGVVGEGQGEQVADDEAAADGRGRPATGPRRSTSARRQPDDLARV